MNLKECVSKCEQFGFSEEITRETLWNEAYRLGRRRWYWGPSWLVSLTGWINTQRQREGNNMKHHHYIAIILILVFLCAYLFTALQRSRSNERELSRINQQHQR
jgi:hypothetical protein